MLTRITAMLLLIASPVAPVFSQQKPAQATPAPQQDTVRIGTSAVQMDVVVTDKTGRRINGLTAADFEVVDEGAPQKLDFFSAIEGSRVARAEGRAVGEGAGAATPLATPFQGRFVVFVMDDLHLSTENLMRSRKVLADFISTQLAENDMAAVTATSGSIGLLQQFTNDKQRLLTAINRISSLGGLSTRGRDARFNMTATEAIRIDAGDTSILELVRRRAAADDPAMGQLAGVRPTRSMARPSGGTSGRFRPNPDDQNQDSDAVAPDSANTEAQPTGPLNDLIRAAARTLVAQIGQATRASLKTLEAFLRVMGELPGRKLAVMVTETLITATGTTEDMNYEINRMIDVARRSGVSIYTVDAGGVRAANVTASERITGRQLQAQSVRNLTSLSDFENLGAARALTLGTGGELINNTNDIGAGLRRAFEDSSSYYVIGFTPAVPPDNKFHRLTVSVKGKPEFVVRTRKGYLAATEDTSRGTNAELSSAIMSPVPRMDLPLEVVANVVPRAGEQIVIAGLHVGRNYLTLPAATAPEQTAAYEVLAYLFASGRNDPVGAIQRTITHDFTQDASARQKLKSEGFLLVSQFTQLEPGNYQVRAVVREKATGAVGSSYQFFEIPDPKNRKQVSVSSLVLTPAGQTEFNGHNSFRPGSEMDMRWIIYNAPKEISSITQRVRLVDAAGKVMMDSPLAPAAAAAGADLAQSPQGTRMKLPTARGRYALVVSLQGEKGRVDIERRADFVIE